VKPKLGKKNPNYKQGIFKPSNPLKYKGSFPVVYRSGLELQVFRWMDNNINVTSWGSESVVIPYQSPLDGRVHKYFPDLVAHLNSKDGTIKKLLIEIKPERQTMPPVNPTGRKKPKTMMYEQVQYAVNQKKWEAAKAWATSKGYQFIILTEKNINS
jgi:hypothetical protein